MKIFVNRPKQAGDAYEDSPFMFFGKCFKATCIIERLQDGTALDHDRVFDGWYLLLNLPLEKNQRFVSTVTFENKVGLCRPVLMFRVRKVGQNKYYSLSVYFTWRPNNEEKESFELRYDDPYLAAIKTTEILKGK